MTPEELKLIANLQEQLNRHENVIKKLIDQVMKLEVTNNIQNTINRINNDSPESNEEDISDSPLRT